MILVHLKFICESFFGQKKCFSGLPKMSCCQITSVPVALHAAQEPSLFVSAQDTESDQGILF